MMIIGRLLNLKNVSKKFKKVSKKSIEKKVFG